MYMFLFEVTTCLTSGDESYMCFSFRVDDRLLVLASTLFCFSRRFRSIKFGILNG